MSKAPKPRSALQALSARVEQRDDRVRAPKPGSFRRYLEKHARVKTRQGSGPYTLEGREALAGIVDRIDEILGSLTGKALKDAALAICGGAQWGKTILALQLVAYLTGILFRNVSYYLPDDDLVQGVVDGKLRPEVIDLSPWYAEMMQLGKTVNESGKAVNRKGAFLVTDGTRSALGMIRGMGKVPTTFTADVVLQDEKDDIPPDRAKYLSGRMTSSDLRVSIVIGTQRYAGAGQNKEFEDGSQEVWELIDPDTGEGICPEEHWPQVCRVAIGGAPRRDDPALTFEGVFKRLGRSEIAAAYDADAHYYLANPQTGAPLDRRVGRWVARQPERLKERKYSMRLSQIGVAAIDLSQIVAHWRDAVADPMQMVVFCCDRLAMPRSTSQQLDHKVIDRARETDRFPLSMATPPRSPVYGGLDTGDRCWLVATECASPAVKRLRYAEQIALGRLEARAVELYHRLGLSCLFIDARPATAEARRICWALHGLAEYAWPKITDPESAFIQFPGGLAWNGPASRWQGLKAAVVEFALRPGQGVRHKLGQTQEGAFFPIIQCNRDESIQQVVNELLTVEEGLIHVVEGKPRSEPILRLPVAALGSPPAATHLGQHFLAGSKKETDAKGEEHFVDKCENHYLLAATYARLAETIGGGAPRTATILPRTLPGGSRAGRSAASRRNRALVG